LYFDFFFFGLLPFLRSQNPTQFFFQLSSKMVSARFSIMLVFVFIKGIGVSEEKAVSRNSVE